jgi:hypothetical protein
MARSWAILCHRGENDRARRRGFDLAVQRAEAEVFLPCQRTDDARLWIGPARTASWIASFKNWDTRVTVRTASVGIRPASLVPQLERVTMRIASDSIDDASPAIQLASPAIGPARTATQLASLLIRGASSVI